MTLNRKWNKIKYSLYPNDKAPFVGYLILIFSLSIVSTYTAGFYLSLSKNFINQGYLIKANIAVGFSYIIICLTILCIVFLLLEGIKNIKQRLNIYQYYQKHPILINFFYFYQNYIPNINHHNIKLNDDIESQLQIMIDFAEKIDSKGLQLSDVENQFQSKLKIILTKLGLTHNVKQMV